ncbi:sugar transferase [Cetobacterium sp. 8H]|uniref:sugar transferase n=1 Tax=Cetobacterium sp. 8H TaxID=2759681 RepID=UPI002106C232|nr:sugar transferase [Cetobacterium sp. 8H]
MKKRYFKHLKEIFISLLILMTIHFLSIKYLNIFEEILIYIIIVFSLSLYYIFSILDFDSFHLKSDILYLLGINIFMFSIIKFFYVDKEIFLWFLISTSSFIMIKIFLSNMIRNSQKTLIFIDFNGNIEAVFNENLEAKTCAFKSLDDLRETDEVLEIIYKSFISSDVLDKLFELKLLGINIIEYFDFFEQYQGKINIDIISKEWFLKSKEFKLLHSNFSKCFKRSFDLITSISLLILLLPLFLLTYICIKLETPKEFFSSPAFFKQKRIGLLGKEFTIIKFRSMKIHDPKIYSKYSSKDDKRITKVGKIIRKLRIDELPQLFNVIKGDMSLIGPRPEWNELGKEYEQLLNLYTLRYAMKPGITGLAQVMYSYGANLDDAKRKLEYDIYYIEYFSFLLDLIIIFKTIKIVVFGRGV